MQIASKVSGLLVRINTASAGGSSQDGDTASPRLGRTEGSRPSLNNAASFVVPPPFPPHPYVTYSFVNILSVHVRASSILAYFGHNNIKTFFLPSSSSLADYQLMNTS